MKFIYIEQILEKPIYPSQLHQNNNSIVERKELFHSIYFHGGTINICYIYKVSVGVEKR